MDIFRPLLLVLPICLILAKSMLCARKYKNFIWETVNKKLKKAEKESVCWHHSDSQQLEILWSLVSWLVLLLLPAYSYPVFWSIWVNKCKQIQFSTLISLFGVESLSLLFIFGCLVLISMSGASIISAIEIYLKITIQNTLNLQVSSKSLAYSQSFWS